MRRPQAYGVLIVLITLFLLPVFGAPVKTYRIKKVGKAPNFIALSPDGYRLYATSVHTDELLEISISQRTVVQSVEVGSRPLGLAIANGGKMALVACNDSNTVSFVDLEAFRVVADIKVTGQPNTIAIDPRGYHAFVATTGRTREGFVHIIDIGERRLDASIRVGPSPFAITVSPITELIYVTMGGSNEVWVIDPNSKQIKNKITVGEAPDGIAITPDGKRVFVANSKSGDLSVIDAQANSVLLTIPIGKAPFGVAISNDGKKVFVVNYESRNVAILPTDLSTLDPEKFEVDRGPTDIKVAPSNRTVYVVNEVSDTIIIADLD